MASKWPGAQPLHKLGRVEGPYRVPTMASSRSVATRALRGIGCTWTVNKRRAKPTVSLRFSPLPKRAAAFKKGVLLQVVTSAFCERTKVCTMAARDESDESAGGVRRGASRLRPGSHSRVSLTSRVHN
eukprot:5650358-Prymnesium_polylepis.1